MKKKVLTVVLVASSLAMGCKKKDDKAAEEPAGKAAEKEAPEPKPETPPEPTEPPGTGDEVELSHAAVIRYKVADFDKWKTAFDALADARKEAGIQGHHISRGADDPSLVRVFLPMSETEKFTQMMASDDVKKMMAEAGVEGEPEVTMTQQMDMNPVLDREIPGAAILKDLEDYDRWKKSFDSYAAGRAKAGIVGHALLRSVEDPNHVLLLLQAETQEELDAFFANPKLEEVNAQAGVKGDPEVTMVKSLPGATY